MKEISEIKLNNELNNQVFNIEQITVNDLLKNEFFAYNRFRELYCTLTQNQLLDLKSQIKITEQHLNEVKYLVEKLFYLSKTYGKTEQCIVIYTSELAKFPIDVLQQFLDFRKYNGEFPSLYEITNKIREYGDLRAKLFVEILGTQVYTKYFLDAEENEEDND
jgi:hypothetical protein